MNIRIYGILWGAVVLLYSCGLPPSKISPGKLKAELFAVEKEFCDMDQRDGAQKAFVYFAADSAVIQRRNQVLKGKDAILRQYESFADKGAKLEWTPDFADVSVSGDLGYTYGKYTYTTVDSLGNIAKSEGIFHTVWKRQSDGQWKFVWD